MAASVAAPSPLVHRAAVPRADLLLFDHASLEWHRSPREHPERPERVLAARRALARLPRNRVDARESPSLPVRLAERVHGAAHVARILAIGEEDHDFDADTYAGAGTREAVLRAAGGAAALGAALADGARRGFALSRPPGHHAERDRAMGFCLLNNVALAAEAARDAGARRIAIVDWDAHHGNGTQDIFEADPDVLFVSMHQWPLYPGTGAPGEVGRGAGAGRTVNLAMPPGSGHAEYDRALRELVLPILEEHQPDVLLISAGYDGHVRDPLAELRLTELAYAAMTHELSALASRLDASVGVVLEGGYDLEALEHSLAATLEQAMDGGTLPPTPELRCSPAAQRTISATREALRPFWTALR